MARTFVCCPHCGAPAALSGELEWLLPEGYFGEDGDGEESYEDDETTIVDEYENETEVLRTELPYTRTDEHLERLNEQTVRETHVAGQRTGGLQVETIKNVPEAPKPKPQTRASMQELPTFTACRPPRKKRLTEADAARQGFESYGDSPDQDFIGLTGKEAHLDALLQESYENDLQSRGFNSNII